MGWFDGKTREQELIEEAFAQGQKDSSEDKGTVHEIMTSSAYRLFDGESVAKAYNDGIENARNNPPST